MSGQGFMIQRFTMEARFEIILDETPNHLVVWLGQEELESGRIRWSVSRLELAGNNEVVNAAELRRLPLGRIEAIANREILEWEQQQASANGQRR